MYPEPKLLPTGDRAVSVEFADRVSLGANTRVRTLAHLIAWETPSGIVETVPSFRSLLVHYDPLVVSWEALVATLGALLARLGHEAAPPGRVVEIPCAYGGELGFDLPAVAARLGLSADEVVRLHTEDEYLVYFIGFTPGLPYMVGTSGRLTIPRLDTPRTKTPAGSVGIGGQQCCIYPVESPGGFWILGRTPLALYDPARTEPILLRAGDRVRFRAIDAAEFDRLAVEAAGGRPVTSAPA
jgi:KipI family sensor histidine kinase inhibitor